MQQSNNGPVAWAAMDTKSGIVMDVCLGWEAPTPEHALAKMGLIGDSVKAIPLFANPFDWDDVDNVELAADLLAQKGVMGTSELRVLALKLRGFL